MTIRYLFTGTVTLLTSYHWTTVTRPGSAKYSVSPHQYQYFTSYWKIKEVVISYDTLSKCSWSVIRWLIKQVPVCILSRRLARLKTGRNNSKAKVVKNTLKCTMIRLRGLWWLLKRKSIKPGSTSIRQYQSRKDKERKDT